MSVTLIVLSFFFVFCSHGNQTVTNIQSAFTLQAAVSLLHGSCDLSVLSRMVCLHFANDKQCELLRKR